MLSYNPNLMTLVIIDATGKEFNFSGCFFGDNKSNDWIIFGYPDQQSKEKINAHPSCRCELTPNKKDIESIIKFSKLLTKPITPKFFKRKRKWKW